MKVQDSAPSATNTTSPLAPQVFDFGAMSLRSLVIDDEPWFVAADVCKILGIGNASMVVRSLDDDERRLNNIEGIKSGSAVNLVNEPGLYALIGKSRKAEAKKFQRWIRHDVLPAIRKTGSYSVPGSNVLYKIPTYPEALRALASTIEENTQLTNQVANMKPLAAFAKQVAGTAGSVDLSVWAKAVNIPGLGPNNLLAHLRKLGILTYRRQYCVPKQDYINRGLFGVREGVTVTTNGQEVLYFVSTITGKGQTWLYKKLTGKILSQQVMDTALEVAS